MTEVLAPTGNTDMYLAQMPGIFDRKLIREGSAGGASSGGSDGEFTRNLIGIDRLVGVEDDKLQQYDIASLVDGQYVRMFHRGVDADLLFIFLDEVGPEDIPFRVKSNLSPEAGFRLLEVRKDGTMAVPSMTENAKFNLVGGWTASGRATLEIDRVGFFITD